MTPEPTRPDLGALTAAVRSIERGENPAAPAPRGDAAAARRRRREAMAEEQAALQAAEAAEAAGSAGSPPSPGSPGTSPEPSEDEAEPPAADAEADAARPVRPPAPERDDADEDASPAPAAGRTAGGGPADDRTGDADDTDPAEAKAEAEAAGAADDEAAGAAAGGRRSGGAADGSPGPAGGRVPGGDRFAGRDGEAPEGGAPETAGSAAASGAPEAAVGGRGVGGALEARTARGARPDAVGRAEADVADQAGAGAASPGGPGAAGRGPRAADADASSADGARAAGAASGSPAAGRVVGGAEAVRGPAGAFSAAGKGDGRPGDAGRDGARGSGESLAGRRERRDAGAAQGDVPGGELAGGRERAARGAGPGRGAAVVAVGGRGDVDAGAVARVREVLVAGGAPQELAEKAVRVLGEGAAETLRDDPWAVLGLEGVRPEHADAFARAVLGAEATPGDDRRCRALVGHLMELAAERGHTALTGQALQAALAQNAVPDPAAAVAAAVEDGRLLVFRADGDDEPQDAADGEDGEDGDAADAPVLLGLDRYALAEESLADGLVRLLRSFEAEAADTDPALWERAAADAPSPSAAELIRAVSGSGLVLHSGGEAARAEPVALVAAARAAGLRAYAAAYTDDGRRRLAAALGGGAAGPRPAPDAPDRVAASDAGVAASEAAVDAVDASDAAVTVEDLLDGARGPGRNPDGSLALDLLAVLDAPQLSVVEATDLVEALPDGARLVLSGDPYALWSAGPGRVFADLLAAKVCPRVTSRTPDPGPIGELVSCVGVGELAAVDAPDKEVVVVPARDPREAVHRVVQLVADSVPRAIGVPADRTQVIVPAHGGPVGTRALNAALKERLNPGPGRFAGFDPGDRVVHVPRPGRVLPATVAGADQDGLRLDSADGPLLVPRQDVAATVRHGWAVTGHQAAGMRWPAVVVVVPGDAGPLLTRSWVYTAFGRGERHLSVVQGADQALPQAVAGPAAKDRTTRLVSVLRELAAEG